MPSSDTRGLICQGFKRLMAKKQFDKITVTDISEECGINRQTFYYHLLTVFRFITDTQNSLKC